MLKNLARLESIVEGKIGHFLVDQDCPLHVAKEMVFQFMGYLSNLESQAKAAQEAAKAEQQKNEPEKEPSYEE